MESGYRRSASEVRCLSAERLTDGQIEALCDLLDAVIVQGASVGFLPPVERSELDRYWRQAIQPGNRLLLATIDEQVVGTVQLELAARANGRHRAEVNKLLVHPRWQRHGVGRALMRAVEDLARSEGRTLLHLDTREGDASNAFYRSLGWIEAGRIPRWASSADGALEATVFYYRLLE